MLRSSVTRASRSSAAVLPSSATRQAARARAAPAACLQQQTRQAHAISNPTLANIEKRWEDMPPQEQADLWMSLRDRMKVDWKEMTLQEKKAGVYSPSLHHWELHLVA
jgi:cytochrome c oxidase subunit 4